MSKLDYIKIIAGAVLGAIVAFFPAYLYGKYAGKVEYENSMIRKSLEIINERKGTNSKMYGASVGDLCAALGLSGTSKDECVRRLREDDTK